MFVEVAVILEDEAVQLLLEVLNDLTVRHRKYTLKLFPKLTSGLHIIINEKPRL